MASLSLQQDQEGEHEREQEQEREREQEQEQEQEQDDDSPRRVHVDNGVTQMGLDLARAVHNDDETQQQQQQLQQLQQLQLQQDEETTPKVPLGAVANLCSATLGAGVLSVPYAAAQAGLLASALLMLTAAVATLVSIQFLTTAVVAYRCDSYETLTSKLFGRSARRVVEICVVLFCQGVAVAYLIAIADILQQAELLFIANNRAWTLTAVWCMLCLPLSLLKRIKALQMASAVGIAAIGTLFLAATVHLLQHLPKTSTTSTTISNWPLWPLQGWKSIGQACPVFLFAFSCQVNVCAIFLELPKRNNNTNNNNDNGNNTNNNNNDNNDDEYDAHQIPVMMGVTRRAVATCTALYSGVALVALANFGAHSVAPNLLQNYTLTGKQAGLMQVAAACMAVAVVMAFPLNIFPSRVTCRAFLDHHHHHHDDDDDGEYDQYNQRNHHRHGPHADLTAALLQDYYEQQTQAPQVDSNQAPLFPDTVVVDDENPQGDIHDAQNNQQAPTTTTAAATTTSTIAASQDEQHEQRKQTDSPNDDDDDDNNNVDEPDQDNADPEHFEDEYNNHTNDNNSDDTRMTGDNGDDWLGHVAWTLVLAGSALGLALIVPDISVVFSVLGGTTSSWLGFCVPGLLGLQLQRDTLAISRRSLGQWLMAWLLLVGGIVVGILTTYLTIQSMLHHSPPDDDGANNGTQAFV